MPNDLHVLPSGRLWLTADDAKAIGLPGKVAKAFAGSSAEGLLSLAADVLGEESLPPALEYWRGFAREFLITFCQQTDGEREPVPPPATEELDSLAIAAPPHSCTS